MTDPIKWRDMTPEQKGAVLLAHHEGKVIERYAEHRWGVVDVPNWFKDRAYRVKPDCDSIKMEKIND